MKPVHLAALRRDHPTTSLTRACDPWISTKSVLATKAAQVTCRRCKLTLLYKEAVSRENT